MGYAGKQTCANLQFALMHVNMKTFLLSFVVISLTWQSIVAKPKGRIIGGEEAPKRK